MSLWRQLLTIGLLALLSGLACAGGSGATPVGDGQLWVVHEYVQPPPGRPISIGGYAAIATLRSPADVNSTRTLDLEGDGPALESLAPGEYELEVTVRPASDAIMVVQNGEVHRDLGPVSARCLGTIRITSAERTSVLVTTVGGDSCTVTPAP